MLFITSTCPTQASNTPIPNPLPTDAVTVIIETASNGTWTYILPKAPLCTASVYFQGALNGNFLESSNQRVSLEESEASPAAFEVFARWVESGGTFSISGTTNSTLQRETYGYDFRQWSFELLVDMDLLGDYLNAADFRSAALQLIQAKAFDEYKPWSQWELNDSLVTKVYAHTTRISHLRRFLVDNRCDQTSIAPTVDMDQDDNSEFPAEFLGECLTIALRRAEARACKNCGVGGTGYACGSFNHVKEDAMTCKEKPLCFFHAHGEAGKQQCEQQRQALSL